MSIFNQPINPKISGSLARRQNTIGEGTSSEDFYNHRYDIAFANPQNSWVSLKSSVNVNGNVSLARENVLSAGLHSNIKLGFNQLKFADPASPKAHLDSSYALNNLDTNKGFGKGSANLLGVKPMPGINSVSVDNIGAYGSLRKATVNFQCWDIKQLEILEKLYMRPGYTVLLEFGRASYINEKGKTINPIDDLGFFALGNKNLQEYLNELHKKSIEHEGNYDAFFGYITNYGWNARSDGGYDCKTEIISTGELLESLKSNYSLAGLTDFASLENNPSKAKFKGLILPNYTIPTPLANYHITKLNKEYSENIISGLMYELYLVITYSSGGFIPGTGSIFRMSTKSVNNISFIVNGKKINIDYNTETYSSTGDPQDINDPKRFNDGNTNAYITLRSLVELFNTFILPKSFDSKGTKSNGELVSLSVDDRSYVSKNPLLCLYNSLMLSTNPDMCWIRNNSWPEIISGIQVQTNINPVNPTSYSDPDVQNGAAVRQKLIKWIDYLVTHDETQNESILDQIKADRLANNTPKYYEILSKNYSVLRGGPIVNNSKLYEWGVYNKEGGKQIAQLNSINTSLSSIFGADLRSFGGLLDKTTKYFSFLFEKAELKKLDPKVEAEVIQVQQQIQAAQAQQSAANTARTDLINLSDNLKNFNAFFKDFVEGSDPKFGNIGNIYINLKYAYKLAKDENLTSQDQSGHNKISVSSFFKRLMQDIQVSLGNVNQFEFHIDPIDSIGRIIDLNYINLDKSPNLFTFEIGSNKSIVRDLKLESQIFSDQSSIIAISAQDTAGALGENNSTLVGFNDGITDRMIPRKDSYLNDIYNRENNEKTIIYNYISSLSYIVNEYLKNLLGAATAVVNNPANVTIYGVNIGGDPFQTVKVGANFNPSQVLSYSNSLRDIMYFFTSVTSFNESNKDKQFIPTLLSLTIDGLSGFIIGNLFKVDNNFVPNYYKKGNKLAYILTKVNHELANNDWITTISGYPFNIDANNTSGNDLISEIVNKKVIVSIDPSPLGSTNFGGPNTNVSLANKTFNDIIQDIASRYNVKYSSVVSSAKATLDATFSKAMENMFATMAQNSSLKSENIIITSLRRNISKSGTTNHPSGKGLDFQLGFIDTTKKAIVSGNYPNFKSSNSARTKTTYADQRAVWVGVYGEDQTQRIEKVYNYLINRFNGKVNTGNDVSIEMEVFGTKIRMINENFYPTTYATGPHFHFQLM
jgi:hypothetical protein